MKSLGNKIIILISLGLLAYAGYFGYTKIYPEYIAPCGKPLTYTVTAVDPRFDISKASLDKDLSTAEAIWEHPSGHDLFQEVPSNGEVSVSVVYDYRQQAIDRLKSLGLTIDNSQKSYDQLKSQYNMQLSAFKTTETQVQTLETQYKTLYAQYQQDLRAYNDSKRHSQTQYDQLQNEQNQINALVDQINTKQALLKTQVDNVNALANLLNQLVSTLNMNVSEYNQVGQSTGQEFQEGVYSQNSSGRSITIYEFGTQAELVRVLAHEMGHALGMNHVDDKNAIMYAVNQSTNGKATAADLAELKRACRF